MEEEKSQNNNCGAGGQIKIVGIQSQSPQFNRPAQDTADCSVTESAPKIELAQQQQDELNEKVQQLASVEGQSFSSGGAGGGGGLALKLENCKVGQIVIQVNDQSQLASMMGLKLTQEQN